MNCSKGRGEKAESLHILRLHRASVTCHALEKWIDAKSKMAAQQNYKRKSSSATVLYLRGTVSQALNIPLGPFQIFSNIRGDILSSRCTAGVINIGGKWKKSLIREVLIILFGHL
jgi:hypothetical protein